MAVGPRAKVGIPLLRNIPPTLLVIMPRDGSLTLSDVRGPTLSIVCEPCGRRGRFNVSRLTEQHGADTKLTDLLWMLVGNCPVSAHERCKAVYDGLMV
jgi:hypothetical protein